MDITFWDLIGLTGSFIIITAYLLLQTGKIESTRVIYSVLNAAGAGLIVISLIFDFNLSAFIIEFFWVLISLYGIYKGLKHEK